MKFMVKGLTELPEIRAGMDPKKGFFLDIRLNSTDASKLLTSCEIPQGFKIVNTSTSEDVITFLFQAPESVDTVDALVAADGEIVLNFV